jgi:hypothetical protein
VTAAEHYLRPFAIGAVLPQAHSYVAEHILRQYATFPAHPRAPNLITELCDKMSVRMRSVPTEYISSSVDALSE